MATFDDKTVGMAHAEDIESGHPSKGSVDSQAARKHADRALAIVGDERVELTEEDVGLSQSPLVYAFDTDAPRHRTNASGERPIA